MRKRELPKTMDVLKALPYSERAKLWAKYSPHPFKRQNRSLWYYIQCDRFGIENREKALGQNQTLQRKSIRVCDTCGTDKIQPDAGGDYTQRIPWNHS